jgi:hypothetical protein
MASTTTYESRSIFAPERPGEAVWRAIVEGVKEGQRAHLSEQRGKGFAAYRRHDC